MNKGRRNELAKLKRKKRIGYLVRGLWRYTTKDGRHIYQPKVSDIPDDEQTVLKSTGKPCSCVMCSPCKLGVEKDKYRV
jgi:ribosomal protein L34